MLTQGGPFLGLCELGLFLFLSPEPHSGPMYMKTCGAKGNVWAREICRDTVHGRTGGSEGPVEEESKEAPAPLSHTHLQSKAHPVLDPRGFATTARSRTDRGSN